MVARFSGIIDAALENVENVSIQNKNITYLVILFFFCDLFYVFLV